MHILQVQILLYTYIHIRMLRCSYWYVYIRTLRVYMLVRMLTCIADRAIISFTLGRYSVDHSHPIVATSCT